MVRQLRFFLIFLLIAGALVGFSYLYYVQRTEIAGKLAEGK